MLTVRCPESHLHKFETNFWLKEDYFYPNAIFTVKNLTIKYDRSGALMRKSCDEPYLNLLKFTNLEYLSILTVPKIFRGEFSGIRILHLEFGTGHPNAQIRQIQRGPGTTKLFIEQPGHKKPAALLSTSNIEINKPDQPTATKAMPTQLSIAMNTTPNQPPTAAKSMPGQQPIIKVPFPMSTTVPDSKNNAKLQEQCKEFESSIISISPALEYPKKVSDLSFVMGIYKKVTDKLHTEFIFLEELCPVLRHARFRISNSQIPFPCSIMVNELKIPIHKYPCTIRDLTNQIDSLEQLMNQNKSFGKKLENESCYMKNVILDYYKLDQDENFLQSGYLATIETIESTSKEIQRFWSSYLQSPVVSTYFPKAESQRSQSFADNFFAIFNMVISLYNGYQCLNGCHCPKPWSFHMVMKELMNNFQSLSTVGV
jgi:hypothetical protein